MGPKPTPTKRKAGEPDPTVVSPSSPVPKKQKNENVKQNLAIVAKGIAAALLDTKLLAAWLQTLPDFREANIGVGEGDRQLMLDWAVGFSKKVPSYEAAVALWRKTDAISAAPPRREMTAPAPAPDESETTPANAGGDAAVVVATPARPSATGPAQRAKSPVPDEDGVDSSDDEDIVPGRCTHCYAVAPGVNTHKFSCAACGLVSGKPESSAVNVARRASAAASVASGSSASGKSKDDTATAAPKLSAVDKELARLTEEGEPFPRFADTTALSPETALQEIRQSWCGSFFAHPSPALIKYIQSGKFKEPGFAVPRSAAEAESARSREAQGLQLRLVADIGLTTSASVTFPKVADSRALIDAFLGTIGPALFDRPRALLDWFMLVRTVLALERADGWTAASHYLTTLLADSIPTRQPFGEYQPRIRDQAALRNFAAHPGGGASGSSVASTFPSAPAAPRTYDDAKESACRNWNKGGCSEPCVLAPKRDHVCMWKACTDSKPHRGIACSHAPAAFVAAPRTGAAGAPRPRGQRGSAGRGGSRPAGRM